MSVFLGAIRKGNERSGRFLPYHIKVFIDTLTKTQLRKIKRRLAAEMRLTAFQKNKKRYQDLERELEYINFRLEL